MKMCKRIFLLLFVAVIVLLCGMFPTIAGRIQDSYESQNTTVAQMKTIQFSEALTDFEKLSLIRYGVMAEVSENKVRMSQQDVYTSARFLLEPYIGNQLLPFELDANSMENFAFQAKPALLYYNTASKQTGIFWLIDMKSPDGLHSISMCIDDQDGKLMIISYYNEEEMVYENLGLSYTDLLGTFGEVYLGQLVLGDSNLLDKSNGQTLFSYKNAYGSINAEGKFMISDIEEQKDYSAVNFYWGDSKEGALDMQFVVHSHGFYNEWQ